MEAAIMFNSEQREAIKALVHEVIASGSPQPPFLLTEQTIRIEESLKHQGDLIEKMLHQMDKRFEQVNKRFEQVDKRFEQVDKRFEQVDKRFEQVDKRFEQVDKRFEELRQDMNKRFSMQQWFMGLGFTLITVVMSLYNYLG